MDRLARALVVLVILLLGFANVTFLVSYLMFLAQSTTRYYITAEGDFDKEICTVERTNKAEIRPEEQSERTENCREKLCIEIQLKGP